MNKIFRDVQCHGLNLLDIGSSGSLDVKWDKLTHIINLTGFDPNAEECHRQNNLATKHRSKVFLPYAIYSETGRRVLYKTESIFCSSLLKPNKEWLARFSFSSLFNVKEEALIEVKAFKDIQELENYEPDVMKIDVQGAELPILAASGQLLSSAFYVETESGFTENYIGETTFSQIDQFMRDNDFLMFDINPNHRISRSNILQDRKTGREQILWAEAVWLKDYIAINNRGNFDDLKLSELKARKVLLLCALQKCYDFGFELAVLFNQKGLIADHELETLSEYESWVLE